jgi:uncharacterized membrane protein YfcA
VGSGSLVTFPTLIALGYPPVLANVSNNVGLVPGSVSGVYGYRRELAGQGHRIARLVPASIAGGVTGAVLLFVLPGTVFKRVVVVLIVIALVLVVAQPMLSERVAARRAHRSPVLLVSVLLAGVYGGYFGAAQGIILIGLLSIFIADELQRLNAAKNVLALAVNGVASIVFLIATEIDWKVAGLIAVGSSIGGVIGAFGGRRLNPTALRAVIIVVGVIAIVRLV